MQIISKFGIALCVSLMVGMAFSQSGTAHQNLGCGGDGVLYCCNGFLSGGNATMVVQNLGFEGNSDRIGVFCDVMTDHGSYCDRKRGCCTGGKQHFVVMDCEWERYPENKEPI